MALRRPLSVFIFGLIFSLTIHADDWPTFRRTNYIALLCPVGKEMTLCLRSEQRTAQYGEELNYVLVGPDSNELTSSNVRLGSTATITAVPRQEGLCVLELEAGWNICFFDSGETPFAYVASERTPLHTIKEIERLYFYVPKDCKRLRILVVADVTGEAARIQVFSPDGQVVREEEGDYDTRGEIKVDVPDGSNGKVWSLAVVKPKAPGLGLDDVVLWLDSNLPPYLCKKADWALTFGKRKHD